MLTTLTLIAALTGVAQLPAPRPPQNVNGAYQPFRTSRNPAVNGGANSPIQVYPPVTQPKRFPLQQQFPSVAAPRPVVVHGPRENLTRFDPYSARLKWVNGDWQLFAGSTKVKDFGRHESDAREALRIIRRLRLNQRGTVGAPSPIMEYWLVDGKAPRVLGSSLRVNPIDVATLRLVQIEKNWCVRDKDHLLFNFGVNKEQAEQAARIIQQYLFTHMGHVGYPQPTMMFFISDERGLRQAATRPSEIDVASIPKEVKPAPKHTVQSQIIDPKLKYAGMKREQIAKSHAQQLARGMRQLAAPMTGATAVLRFDPRRISLRQDKSRWLVVSGDKVLGDFGANLYDAQLAAKTLRIYGCNEQCLVGYPAPAFSYFLVNGRAPRGVRYGLRGGTFHTDKIQVKSNKDGWCVCENERPLINFGPSRENAEELARAIHRHQFDYIGRIGNSMTILTRSR